MIERLKPYPAAKQSGVKWLGSIPAHWQVRRLKTLCSRSALYGANISADSYTTSGVRFLRTTDITERGELTDGGVFLPEELARDYILAEGDLLVSRSGTIGRSLLYSHESHGRCAYAGYLVRFRPSPDTVPKFLFLYTKTRAFEGFLKVSAISSTIENVNGEKYANCPLPLPPLPEQTAIARFLDHMDRRIQQYIRAKEKLIALLDEYKQALIHQAVTGQIDVRTGRPYGQYNESGVEWLGRVPGHWDVVRVKQSAAILRGKFTHRPRNDPAFYDGPYPFIQTGDVARAEKEITEYTQTLNHRGLAVSQMFPAGTLVMAIAANIGDVALLDFEACFPDSVVGFVPREGVERDFVFRVFQAMKSELIREAPVNTQGNLNVDRIGSMTIPIPPETEQLGIMQHLQSISGLIDTASIAARDQALLSREYRARLIADVVTGKLDVREAAASLPDIDRIDGEDASTPINSTDFRGLEEATAAP